jgi:alkylation response protein AidB-like acyl-CoA dehydrogenase
MNDADQDRLILDSVDRFLERHVRPFAMKLEHDDIYPTEIVERMKEMGLFGAVIPTDYGGLGLSAATYAKIIERISAVWMSVSGIVNSHLIMLGSWTAWARPRRSMRSCRDSRRARCAAASR